MATVGTLFVNIAARTSPFVAAVRGSARQLQAMATSRTAGIGSVASGFGARYSAALAAYGRTTKSIFTGQTTYTGMSRVAAGMLALSPALGRGGFAMLNFGTRAAASAAQIKKGLSGLTNAFGFGKISGLLSLAAIGTFFVSVTKLSIARFREIRGALYDLTRTWRMLNLEAARAFAPAVMAATQLLNAKLNEYFRLTRDEMGGLASGGLVVVGIFATLADVVRIVFNAVTALGRLLIGIGALVGTVIEGITDAIGLTDSTSNESWLVTKDMFGGIGTDFGDMLDAGASIGDTWGRVYEGVESVQGGPGAAGLTEGGYGGSAALIDEARRQNAQLQRIENAILTSGGLR